MTEALNAIIIQKTPAGDWDETIDWTQPSRCLHNCIVTQPGYVLIKSAEGYSPFIYKDSASRLSSNHIIKYLFNLLKLILNYLISLYYNKVNIL